MFVPFETLTPSTRVWIYQSNRKFSPVEYAIIENELKLFTDRWAAHGKPLKTSFKIANEQFIVLAVDEAHYPASGCSIDDSVREIQEIGQKTGLDFFDRNLVAFLIDGSVKLVAIPTLKSALQNGTWNADTLMFNNLVSDKAALEANWVTAARNTWLKRYLVTEKLAH